MGKPLRFDLQGQTFGFWTVLERAPGNKWKCRCKCGTEKGVYGTTLRNGLSRSCGCYSQEAAKAKRHDLSGRRVGKLLVLQEHQPGVWTCKCDCGNDAIVAHRALSKSETRSCGCLKTPDDKSLHRAQPKLYAVWAGMLQRCVNPRHKSYKDYGGRGIKVWPAWRESFEQFFADIGARPADHLTIERIDNDGDYRPGNVTWATRAEQRRNRRG